MMTILQYTAILSTLEIPNYNIYIYIYKYFSFDLGTLRQIMRHQFPVLALKLKTIHLIVETAMSMIAAIQLLVSNSNIRTHLITSSVLRKEYRQYTHHVEVLMNTTTEILVTEEIDIVIDTKHTII